MRKTISLMLAAVILLSIGFRSSATETTGTEPGSILAGYVAGETGGQIISVDIDWKDMEFTYYDESQAVWDPVKHEYSEAIAAAWAESTALITVTNHSNVILQADIDYTIDAEYNTMGLAFTDVQPYIGSAETTAGEGEECIVTIRTIPTGYLPPDTPLGTKVGEIKMTMTPVDSHSTVMNSIGSLYSRIPVKSDSLERGTVYYETSDDLVLVEEYFTEANDVVNIPEKENYEKNAALNLFLATYYDKLHIME